jgi:hypothetical protein
MLLMTIDRVGGRIARSDDVDQRMATRSSIAMWASVAQWGKPEVWVAETLESCTH